MRLRSLAAGCVLVLTTTLALAGSAAAQTDETGEGETGALIGTLEYRDEANEPVPVEGVTIAVVDSSGAEVGGSITDATGEFLLEELAPGQYVATIDPAELPEGVTLRDASRTSVTVTIDAGRQSRALFALTAGEGGGVSSGGGVSGTRLAQLTAEGIKLGLYLAMASIGLSLIFGTTGLTNFAHAEMVTFGQLSTYFFNVYGLAGALGFMASWPAPLGDGVNLMLAVLLGVVTGGVLGYVLDRLLFRNFRAAGVSLIAQMVITIGLSIGLRYVFLYFFGGGPRTFVDYSAQTARDLGPIELTDKDITAMIISVVVLALVGVLLQGTRTGKAMRAVADNRELAESTGIDVQKVISYVWISGGALAGLGGAFLGLDQVKWDLGWRILLLLFASVVLGGLGTAYGALVGALVIGLLINVSTLWIDAELKNLVALASLVLILMVRPQGILGQKERIG